MAQPDIHFIGFLPEDKREITGLTDDLSFPFLPVLLNFNIFSLNIINGLKNDFSSYAFLFDYEDKTVTEYLSNPGFIEKINQINISLTDQYRFFNQSIIEYINYKKIEDNDYLLFIPCNVSYLWKIDKEKINQNCQVISFDENSGISIKVKYLKNILGNEKIEHFDTFYGYIYENTKIKLDANKDFSFYINNLFDYLNLHLMFFKNPELILFTNSLAKSFNKIGETFISKEAEILNSYIGQNTMVRGKVEDSIIFNDVVMLQDTHIQNSIILPGNVIAKGVNIKNSIIGYNKNPMKDITIGPSTKIGFTSQNNLKNIRYENELPEGYTLIGNNILLPGGINIGKNCVIRGKINVLELKKMKTLVDGGTFEQIDNA